MDEQTIPIQIKGLRDGLLITFGNGEWAALERALLEQIHAQGSFFQGARIALDVGTQILKVNGKMEKKMVMEKIIPDIPIIGI